MSGVEKIVYGTDKAGKDRKDELAEKAKPREGMGKTASFGPGAKLLVSALIGATLALGTACANNTKGESDTEVDGDVDAEVDATDADADAELGDAPEVDAEGEADVEDEDGPTDVTEVEGDAPADAEEEDGPADVVPEDGPCSVYSETQMAVTITLGDSAVVGNVSVLYAEAVSGAMDRFELSYNCDGTVVDNNFRVGEFSGTNRDYPEYTFRVSIRNRGSSSGAVTADITVTDY